MAEKHVGDKVLLYLALDQTEPFPRDQGSFVSIQTTIYMKHVSMSAIQSLSIAWVSPGATGEGVPWSPGQTSQLLHKLLGRMGVAHPSPPPPSPLPCVSVTAMNPFPGAQ